MPQFFIQKKEIKNNYITLSNKDDLAHIVRARRCKAGEKIKFIDEKETLYFCEVKEISKTMLKAKILSKEKSCRKLKNNICLIQSVLSADSQNLLIANAIQTGVKKIYPVISDNICSRVQKDRAAKWQKVALENFKQCERADIAQIKDIMLLRHAIESFKKNNVLVFAEKDDNISLDNALKDIDKTKDIAVVIGPEGGFSEHEFEYFKESEYKLISLGPMIYKAPNAVVAAISNIASRIE